MKKWINNIWVITIVGGLIYTLISFLITSSNATISNLPIIIWAKSEVNFSFKIYKLFLTLIILFFVIRIIKKIISFFNNSASNYPKMPPPFFNYKKDTFKQWEWVWRYDFFGGNEYDIILLLPLCPKCNYKMLKTNSYHSTMYSCPNCQTKLFSSPGRYWEYEQDIKALIEHNIDNGNYEV